MQKQAIRPQFHYTYKGQAVILDSQYNYQGNILAVSTSFGELYFYQSSSDQANRDHIYYHSEPTLTTLVQHKKYNAILKVAWSDPNFSTFVTASIEKTIFFYNYKIEKEKGFSLTPVMRVKCDWVPLSLSFCPIDHELILAVGLSDGSILLYDNDFNLQSTCQAHQQSVNSLAWQHRLDNSSKNQWILSNFPKLQPVHTQLYPQSNYPLLLSCSSDMHIAVWRLYKHTLKQLGRIKAHDKQIRQVQWKPNCFSEQEKSVVSCSEDGYVKIWAIGLEHGKEEKVKIQKKSERNFNGPVYKASYNLMGTVIAICYCNQEEKVQTMIMKEQYGVLENLKKCCQ